MGVVRIGHVRMRMAHRLVPVPMAVLARRRHVVHMVVMAVINLIFLLFAIFGQTTLQAVAIPALLNLLVLLLAFLPGTKAAFGQPVPARK